MNHTVEMMTSLVNQALKSVLLLTLPQNVSPTPFELTPHEQDSMSALVHLLNGQYNNFLSNISDTGSSEKIRMETLEKYHRKTIKSKNILLWALLLHDLAKNRFDSEVSEIRVQKEHPPLGAEIVEIISPFLIKNSRTIPGAEINERDIQCIIWLIRYHNILGNVYTGEMKPSFLLMVSQQLPLKQQRKHFELLEVVTLCDLRGTRQGIYLTESKAQFWLTLSDATQVKAKETQLFGWRIKRWTGSPAGIDKPENERAFYNAFRKLSKHDRQSIQRVFHEKINYIVYGFYLFTALSPSQLLTLLHSIAQEAETYPGNNITLRFNTVYKPPNRNAGVTENQSARKDLETIIGDLNNEKLRHHYTLNGNLK